MPVTDAIAREASLYYRPITNSHGWTGRSTYAGCDGFEGIGLADQDLMTGDRVLLTSKPQRPGVMSWQAQILPAQPAGRDDGFRLASHLKPNDVSYDSQRQQVVVQAYNSRNYNWELNLYRKESDWHLVDKLLAMPKAFTIIEFDHEGQVLLARDKQLLQLKDKQLQTLKQFDQPIQDLNTLSDGGLCVRLRDQGPAQHRLLYLEPDLSQVSPLPLAHPFQQLKSPQGDLQAIFIPHSGTLAKLDICDLEGRSRVHFESQKVAQGLPFAEGFDFASAGWSPDGRFFAISSPPFSSALGPVQDTWLYDSQQPDKGLILPGVAKIEFLPQGQLQLDDLTLEASELASLNSTPWYQARMGQVMGERKWEASNLYIRQDNPLQPIRSIFSPYDVTRGLPFSQGYDYDSSQLSPDGKYFSITSKLVKSGLKPMRDSWIWDGQKGHLLPGCSKVEHIPEGFRLHLQDGQVLDISFAELPQQSGKAWYQQQWQQPQFYDEFGRLSLRYRSGSIKDLVTDRTPYSQVALTQDKDLLLAISQDRQQCRIWNLDTGLDVQLQGFEHIHWDEQQDQLRLQRPGQAPESLLGRDLKQSSHYKAALLQETGATPPPFSGRQPDGSYNGLRMPKRQPTQ